LAGWEGGVIQSAPIVVSGFGRCGTSLVMQMLAAGGVPCLGRFPSYESSEAVGPGQAVKILDPQRAVPIPYAIPTTARVIWIDRDIKEQAASLAKFIAALSMLPVGRDERRRLAHSLRSDRPHALRALGSRQTLMLSFEGLLSSPTTQADRILRFVGGSFDAAVAARQVRQRSPKCATGLDMELALMHGGGH
jgi:hypothetical protein